MSGGERASMYSAQSQVKRPNMSQLSSVEVQSAFNDKCAESLDPNWSLCTTVQQKWDLLESSVQSAAQDAIPTSNNLRSQRTGSWRMKV